MKSGTTLADRYIVRETTLRTVCGDFYLAQDVGSGLLVSLQTIPTSISENTSWLADLHRNFLLLHTLDHPHIAKMHALEYDPEHALHFLVREHVFGVNLLEYRLSRPGQRVTIGDAVAICRQVADALDHAHRSLLHRNIQPEYITLTPEGYVKLWNFDLVPHGARKALQYEEESDGDPSVAREGYYRAPEHASGPLSASPASDRWALATLFYELVAGKLPFEKGLPSPSAPIPPPPPIKKLGKRRNQVLVRAFSTNPSQRFPSAITFVEALESAWLPRSVAEIRKIVTFALLAVVVLTVLAWGTLVRFFPLPSSHPSVHSDATSEEVALTPDLKKSLLLQIESRPTAATVVLDGKRLGTTPFTVGRVAPGAYHLWLEKPGYKPVDMEIDLTQDTIVSMNLDLAVPTETPDSAQSERTGSPVGLMQPPSSAASAEPPVLPIAPPAAAPIVPSADSAEPPAGTALPPDPPSKREVLPSTVPLSAATPSAEEEESQEQTIPLSASDKNRPPTPAPLSTSTPLPMPLQEPVSPLNILPIQAKAQAADVAQPDPVPVPQPASDAAPPGEVTPPVPAPSPTAESAESARIRALLEEAEQDIQAARLTLPKGRNAAEKYLAIQQVVPDHPEAKQGMTRIANQLIVLANEGIKAGYLTQPPRRNACEKLLAVLTVDSRHPELGKSIGKLVARYLPLAKPGQTPQPILTLLDRAAAALPEDPDIASARQALSLPADPPAQSTHSQQGEADETRHYLAIPTTPPDETSPRSAQPPVKAAMEPLISADPSGSLTTISQSDQGALKTWREPISGLSFVWIPGGCFEMGSGQGNGDEVPVHSVCLEGFWMGRHEVTQGAWQRVMNEQNPSHFNKGGNHPLDSISWEETQRFIQRLNSRSGARFRLPTEAEWEYGCRAGSQSPFYFGNSIHAGKANFNGMRHFGDGPKGHYVGSTVPVASFPANHFGLFDMHGNVSEWVSDIYRADAYQVAMQSSPSTTSSDSSGGGVQRHVLRGGAWYSTPEALRCAARYWGDANSHDHGQGFRLLREEKP